MFDRFSSVRDVLIRLCLGIFVFIVSACGTPPESIQPPIPTCIPTNVVNPYLLDPPLDTVKNIYTLFKNGGVDSQAIARQDAFSYLGKNMRRWSDYNDIMIDNARMIRIGVTYLDPALVQYIVLNHALGPQSSVMDSNAFNTQIQMVLNNLSQRNAIIFIITITSLSYNPKANSNDVLYVDIPIEKLTLNSASGIPVKPIHYTMSKNANITQGPVYGIVYYPVAILTEGSCTGIVDQRIPSLILNSVSFPLGETNVHAQSWSIDYQPLILEDNYHPTPTLDITYNFSRFNSSASPPTPNVNPVFQIEDMNSSTYWEEMGRYIWDKVIIESAH